LTGNYLKEADKAQQPKRRTRAQRPRMPISN